MSKFLIAAHSDFLAASTSSAERNPDSPSPAITPVLIAQCGRTALAAIRMASGGDPRWLALCAAVIEREALPQAGRWHRRDLVPAATAAWRAVVRALRTPDATSAVVITRRVSAP